VLEKTQWRNGEFGKGVSVELIQVFFFPWQGVLLDSFAGLYHPINAALDQMQWMLLLE
jgi:hypothetical protein